MIEIAIITINLLCTAFIIIGSFGALKDNEYKRYKSVLYILMITSFIPFLSIFYWLYGFILLMLKRRKTIKIKVGFK